MKEVLSDVFSRFLARVNAAPGLRADQITTIEYAQSVNALLGTALILGDDGKKTEPMAVLAIVPPSLATDHPQLLELAMRRARANKAPYFLTWTLRDAALWRTPRPGTPSERGSLKIISDYEDNYRVASNAAPEVFTESMRRELVDGAQHFLDDLTGLYRNQALELVNIDATYFVGSLIKAVHELLPLLADSLHMRLDADLELRGKLESWAVLQGIAGSTEDRDFAVAIARQIIYRLLGKILFYQSLRRAARQLPPLELSGVDPGLVLQTLRHAFAKALQIDYHAVFSEDIPDTITWPGEATKRLAALIDDFNTRDFSRLPQDVVGVVFERLIPPEERHGLGQYFTSEQLCDLTTAFCVRSANDNVCDPTCGTGTFLVCAYGRLRWLGTRDHGTLLSRLWGIDIAPFPAELAVINLFRQDIAATSNFPRIACRDFFTLNPGDKLPFPPPKMDLERPETIDEPMPLFDAIVGNFPYVSAERIGERKAGYLDYLRRRLIEGWFSTYPQLFEYNNKREQVIFEKAIASGHYAACNREHAQLRTSMFADLYVYFFLGVARFLKPGGRMGIITSNAWLDVNYGFALQKFLCDRFKIVAIVESRCEPWFTEAAVNTILTVIERCDGAAERDAHIVPFVKVKKRLADLAQSDPQAVPLERWDRLDKTVAHIERAGRKWIKTFPLGVITEEDDDFRIRLARQGELRAELEREGKTVKWGRLLRAPEVFLDLEKGGKLCPINTIASCEFGSKTGINEFFHLTPAEAQKRGIEAEFLRPLLKSAGESDSFA